MPYYTALADLLAALVAEDSARLGAEPTAVAGRMGYDPIQEDEAFTCPMADAPAADETEGPIS
jgi:hypothetical protein